MPMHKFFHLKKESNDKTSGCNMMKLFDIKAGIAPLPF